jgi:hypothetical protein
MRGLALSHLKGVSLCCCTVAPVPVIFRIISFCLAPTRQLRGGQPGQEMKASHPDDHAGQRLADKVFRCAWLALWAVRAYLDQAP